jgi:hypothetical protein
MLIVAWRVKKFLVFYGIQSSLPCSQESATSPCPEPDESNPHPPTSFLKTHYNTGPKREEITEDWRKLNDEDLHYSYPTLPQIFLVWLDQGI